MFHSKGLKDINIALLIKCLIFLGGIGIISLYVGKEIPRSWVNPDHFLLKSFKWEKQGKIYDKIKIKQWKSRLPDMSQHLKSMITKEITHTNMSWQSLERLVYESCIAEIDHWVLMILGFGCTYIWKDGGGLVMAILWAFGNLPFIIIQRYNRPNLKRTVQKLKIREQKRGKS